MTKAKDAFLNFIGQKKLRISLRREKLVDLFLENEGHITPGELYILARKKDPSIGLATVYRTMKLLCAAGLARELKFSDGISRYEHVYDHPHHDHLICVNCGKFIEVVDEEIERLQTFLARKHGFRIESHTMDIYGYCSECQRSRRQARRN